MEAPSAYSTLPNALDPCGASIAVLVPFLLPSALVAPSSLEFVRLLAECGITFRRPLELPRRDMAQVK
jgi:hypothetical protein